MKPIRRLAQKMLWSQLLRSEQFLPMKFFMLLGGFLGFLAVMSAGLLAGSDPWLVLLNASIGCVIGAILFRVFRSVVSNSVKEIVIQKHRAAAEASAQQASQQAAAPAAH